MPMLGGVVGVVLSRLLQTVKLQRDAFVWMDFNDRATGDAAILVVVTQLLISFGIGRSLLDLLNPLTLASVLIGGLFFWVMYSAATYAVARFLFDGHGTFAIYLRITGFAYPTLLVMVFFNLLIDNPLIVMVASGAWFVLIVGTGLTYVADLAMTKAVGAAIGGYVLIIIVQTIFGSIFRF